MGLHMGNARLRGDMAGGHFVVTGQHVDLNPLSLKCFHGLHRRILQFVGEGEDGIDPGRIEQERDGITGIHPGTDAVGHHGIGRFGDGAQHFAQQFQVADIVARTGHRTGDSLSQYGLEICDGKILTATEGFADRQGQRMVGTMLQGIQHIAEIEFRRIVLRRNGRVPHRLHHGRLPFRQGAGLVHDHRIDFPGNLQTLSIFNQDSLGSAVADTGDDRGRRGQAQRTGAGDDKDRHHGQKAQGDFPA